MCGGEGGGRRESFVSVSIREVDAVINRTTCFQTCFEVASAPGTMRFYRKQRDFMQSVFCKDPAMQKACCLQIGDSMSQASATLCVLGSF